MIPTATTENLIAATEHLRSVDPLLGAVIDAVGPCSIRPHDRYYQELVQSILGQQLSITAAAAIESRFIALFGTELVDGFPSAAQLAAADSALLRSAGLSRAKVAYVQDLARHVLDGRVSFENFDSMDNQSIIEHLTAVKGIGEWTAHMFLMFSIGRLDVLPTGDLGIRNGVGALYAGAPTVTPSEVATIASTNHWHPYESVASWYVWQSLKLPKVAV